MAIAGRFDNVPANLAEPWLVCETEPDTALLRRLARSTPPAKAAHPRGLREQAGNDTAAQVSEEHKGGRYENWYVFESARKSGGKMRQKP